MMSFTFDNWQLPDDITSDANLLVNIVNDAQFRLVVQDIIGENFEIIWTSKGAAIDSDWNGHDLVQSGRLRDAMTNNPSFRIVGNTIVFNTDVPYGVFVNNLYRYMGITNAAKSKLTNAVIDYLDRNGAANWS